MSHEYPPCYNLRMIINFLSENRISYSIITYQITENYPIWRNHIDGSYPTGCKVYFPDSDIYMFIQTDYIITGSNFAQSFIVNIDGILLIPSQGYGERLVINHYNPEDIFSHIQSMNVAFRGRNAVDFPDAEIYSDITGLRHRPNYPNQNNNIPSLIRVQTLGSYDNEIYQYPYQT